MSKLASGEEPLKPQPSASPSAPPLAPPSALPTAPLLATLTPKIFWIAAAVIFLSGCMVALALAYLRAQAIESAERLTESLAHVVEEQTSRTLQIVDQQLQLIATRFPARQAEESLTPVIASEQLRAQASELPFLRALRVTDAQGRIIYDSDIKNVDISISDRDYFQIYLTKPETEFYVAVPVRSRSTNAWQISATRPLRSANGTFLGVIVAAMEPSYFERLWQNVDLGIGSSIALFRRDGVLMMRSPPQDAAVGKNFRDSPMFQIHLPQSPTGSYQNISGIDGVARMFAYRTLSTAPSLVLAVGQSMAFALTSWRKLAYLAIVIWASGSLVIIVLSVFLNRALRQKARAEGDVRQLAERLSLATDAAQIGVWDWDVQNNRWYATETHFNMLGYTSERGFHGRRLWLERLHPDDKERVVAKIEAVLEGADLPYEYEARMRHEDGSYRWISVAGRVVERSPAGKPTRLSGVRRDISARREDEQALRDSEARYREMFKSNPHPMWTYHLGTLRFEMVNDAAIAHYGYSELEFLSMTIRDIRPPEDIPDLLNAVALTKPGFRGAQLWRHRRKDGSIILVEITSHSFALAEHPTRLVLAHDVTAQKQAEEQLRLSEQNLAITLLSIGDAVIATDDGGAVTRMNATAERLTGWSIEEALGRPLPEVFHIVNSQTRAVATNPAKLVMEHGDVVGLANHTALLARDGREYQIFDSAAPIRDPAGKIVGVVVVFSDVTESYRLQRELERTAELLERTGQVAKVGGWELDLETKKMFWSLETCRIHELDPPEAPSFEQGLNLFAPEARPVIQAAIQAAIDDGISYDLELRKFTVKGRSIWIRTQGSPVIEDGKVVKLIGAFHDITARKLAELESANERLVLELVAQGGPLKELLTLIVLAYESMLPDMKGSVLLLDPNGRQLRHGAAPNLPPAFCNAIDGIEIGPEVGSCGTAAFTKQTVIVGDITQDRRWRDYKDIARSNELGACWSVPILSAERQVLGTFAFYYAAPRGASALEIASVERGAQLVGIAIGRDLAETALRSSEAALIEAQRVAHIGSWDWNVLTGVAVWSDEFCRIFGRDRALGPPNNDEMLSMFQAESAARLVAAAQHTMQTGEPYQLDLQLNPKLSTQGVSSRWIATTGEIVKNPDGATIGLRGIVQDISDRVEAEAKRTSLENQLRESQKMEAIGTLAGGIAHDFNNILATILGNAELAREDASSNPQALESLTEIRKAASRARDLVQQILSFSRRQPTERKPVSLSPIVEEAGRLLRATLPARLNLHVVCADNLPRVLADITQMEQVVLNLATNAMQAMDNRPGNIKICVDTVALERTLIDAHPALEAMLDKYPVGAVRLVVADDAHGMDEATVARIFDPFFTTKELNEGTGLGLSVVHGIVTAHEGVITVDSQPGMGTAFTIYLPITEQDTDSETGSDSDIDTDNEIGLIAVAHKVKSADIKHDLPGLNPPPAVGATQHRGQGDTCSILYLDDDESLVFLVERLLAKRGVDVSGFCDQHEALAVLRADPAKFALMVTDYNMPGMSGLEVAREVHVICPDLPVVVASGFIDETLREQADGAGIRELIFKANGAEQLCDAFVRIATEISKKY